jgi:hypothetical protein
MKTLTNKKIFVAAQQKKMAAMPRHLTPHSWGGARHALS